MTPTAQITICGVLGKDTIAALVEVAMAAGAALLVQPRALPAPPPVVAPSALALPPARRARKVPKAAAASRTVQRRSARRAVEKVAARAASAAPDERVRRALRNGPLLVAEFLQITGLDKYAARQLVASGAIVATGATRGRRYALPGPPAKEVP